MKFILYLKSKLTFYVALSLTFILASCGSYQYVGYDSDGIYGSDEIVYENSYRETPNSNNNYYKNYFDEKSRQFENLSEDGDIFTDIDSYQGDYEEVEDSTYVGGYSGWGQDNTDVTINVYSNYGYSNWWYRPYAWNWYRPYYGWNSYWYDPYWYSPFYGYGYGYAGFYGGFGFYSPYYGSYWNYSPYWYGHHRNRYYYNGYYGSRNIAYNAGRRGSTSNYTTNRTSSLYNRTSSVNNRASSLNRRSSSNIFDNNTFTRTRNSSNSTSDRRRNFQNSSLSRNFSSTTRPRVNNSSRPRVNNSSRPNVNNRSYSTSRPSNNSNSFRRSSSGSSGSSTRSFSSGSSNRSSSGNTGARSSSGNNGSRSSSGSRRSNQ